MSLTALAKWDTVLSDLDKSSAVWVIALSGEVTVNGEELLIMKESDILGIITDDAAAKAA